MLKTRDYCRKFELLGSRFLSRYLPHSLRHSASHSRLHSLHDDSQTMQGKKTARGFTLIEIAIVMVVLGVIMGGVLVPAYNLATQDAYDREQEKMETIKTAIYGYAASNRTKGNRQINIALNLTVDVNADVFAVSENLRGMRLFSLPAGRPYLPCPDVNGDGYEDRANYSATGHNLMLGVMPLLIPAGPYQNRTLFLTDRARNAMRQPLVEIGMCASSRGILPWRTLGVPPTDSWGNLYTYYADVIASDSLVGFNQNTNLDKFDTRTQIRSVTTDLLFGEREEATVQIQREGTDIDVHNYSLPLVICNGLPCNFSGASSITIFLAEGEVADGDFNILYRNFEKDDVVTGVPFALVSHGKNGLAAINYSALQTLKADTSAAAQIRCFIGTGLRARDTQPEFYNTAETRGAEISNSWDGCTPPVESGGGSGVMVHLPLGAFSGRTQIYDDIVVWSSMGELIDVMQENRVLPAPDFTTLREY